MLRGVPLVCLLGCRHGWLAVGVADEHSSALGGSLAVAARLLPLAIGHHFLYASAHE